MTEFTKLDRLADIMEAKPNSPAMWIGVGGFLGYNIQAVHNGAEIVFTHTVDNKRALKKTVQTFLDGLQDAVLVHNEAGCCIVWVYPSNVTLVQEAA